jgi:hypothetical protein
VCRQLARPPNPPPAYRRRGKEGKSESPVTNDGHIRHECNARLL